MNIQQFQAKWRGTGLKERAAAQEHFIDLCRVLEQKRRYGASICEILADPTVGAERSAVETYIHPSSEG